jgi:osmotically-inducible protein OsmY
MTSGPVVLPPGHSGPEEHVAVVSPAHRKLEEMKVELAWHADLATFSYKLDARIEHDHMEVRGYVPNEAIKEKALAIARKYTAFPVVDRLKLMPTLATRSVGRPAEEVKEEASQLLAEKLGGEARSFEIKTTGVGEVTLAGTVNSVEDKLAASHLLRQVRGCGCVINQLTVASVQRDGRMMTAITRDGKETISGALPDLNAVVESDGFPVGGHPIVVTSPPMGEGPGIVVTPPLTGHVPLAQPVKRTLPPKPTEQKTPSANGPVPAPMGMPPKNENELPPPRIIPPVPAKPAVLPLTLPSARQQPAKDIAPTTRKEVVSTPPAASAARKELVSGPLATPVLRKEVVSSPPATPAARKEIVATPPAVPATRREVVSSPPVTPVIKKEPVADPLATPVLRKEVVSNPPAKPAAGKEIVATPPAAPATRREVVSSPPVTPVIKKGPVADPLATSVTRKEVASTPPAAPAARKEPESAPLTTPVIRKEVASTPPAAPAAKKEPGSNPPAVPVLPPSWSRPAQSAALPATLPPTKPQPVKDASTTDKKDLAANTLARPILPPSWPKQPSTGPIKGNDVATARQKAQDKVVPAASRSEPNAEQPKIEKPKSDKPVGYYETTGMVLFDDEPRAALPANQALPLSPAVLKQRVESVCGKQARKVQIVTQPDGSLRVKVTLADPLHERTLTQRLLALPEMASPRVHLETLR